MYTALELSKYIVHKCITDRHPVSNLQLQKILYYIQKKYLCSYDKQAFSDDIEAWQFGPVVPNVYYYYCGYGAMAITNPYENFSIDVNDVQTINDIVETKRVLNPWDMVLETHKPNGAWHQIYNGGLGNGKQIPIELIKAVG